MWTDGSVWVRVRSNDQGPPPLAPDQLVFDALYLAALEPSQWRSVLQRLASHVGASGAVLVLKSSIEDVLPFEVGTSLVVRDKGTRHVLCAGDPEQGDPCQIEIHLFFDQASSHDLAGHAEFFDQFERHLARCLMIIRTSARRHGKANTLEPLIAGFPTPLGLVDPLGRLICANPAACAVLGIEKAQHWIGGPAWKELITLTQAKTKAQMNMDVAGKVICVQLTMLERRDRYHPGDQKGWALLEVLPPDLDLAHILGLVGTRFHLSRTELHSLEAVLMGQSIQDIAALRGCTCETVRDHLRQCRRKTGTANLPGLIDLVQKVWRTEQEAYLRHTGRSAQPFQSQLTDVDKA
jgi:DNA-binding CsgD family transcriptional regulator